MSKCNFCGCFPYCYIPSHQEQQQQQADAKDIQQVQQQPTMDFPPNNFPITEIQFFDVESSPHHINGGFAFSPHYFDSDIQKPKKSLKKQVKRIKQDFSFEDLIKEPEHRNDNIPKKRRRYFTPEMASHGPNFVGADGSIKVTYSIKHVQDLTAEYPNDYEPTGF